MDYSVAYSAKNLYENDAKIIQDKDTIESFYNAVSRDGKMQLKDCSIHISATRHPKPGHHDIYEISVKLDYTFKGEKKHFQTSSEGRELRSTLNTCLEKLETAAHNDKDRSEQKKISRKIH